MEMIYKNFPAAIFSSFEPPDRHQYPYLITRILKSAEKTSGVREIGIAGLAGR